MKRAFGTLSFLFLLVASVIMTTGCATTISAEVQRPAEFDLPGAKNLAILSFKPEETKSIWDYILGDYQEEKETDRIARYISNELSDLVAADNYFTLIDGRSVQRAMEQGRDVPCDVYVTGYIATYNSDIKDVKRTKKDDDDNEITYYEYKREVSCKIVYQIVDARSNKILYTDSNRFSQSSICYERKTSVPSGDYLLRSSLSSLAKTIVHKMQPYYEKVHYTLLKDKTKDPDMKSANQLAKKGFVGEACDLFMDIYINKGYMEAGYNAAILYQAQGAYYTAMDQMQEIVNTFHTTKAADALASIKKDVERSEKLRNQIKDHETSDK